MFAVGNVVRFEYNDKVRHVRIDKVRKSSGNFFVGPCVINITGWDYNADHPVGGYRTFDVKKMENIVLIA